MLLLLGCCYFTFFFSQLVGFLPLHFFFLFSCLFFCSSASNCCSCISLSFFPSFFFLLISQLPAQFIISIVLLGQTISILGGKLTNHNFHLFLFLGSSEARRHQMESCPKMHFSA